MIIDSVIFKKRINGTDPILDEPKPHIVFVGRSNVGKSSIINALCDRNNLVRTSKTPGKTRTLDFFLVNENTYFVDIPGYGFAHGSKDDLEHLRRLIMWYLEQVHIPKRLVILIIDVNVGLKEFDHQMLQLIAEQKLPSLVVANKVDKLKPSERDKIVNKVRESLAGTDMLLFSAKTGVGKDALLKKILSFS
jgi:GTP-binding protein